MKRDLQTLKTNDFDLLVVGGGINGAGIAWDAALRGMSVALVEKGDFGAATSAGCFKIIHGGLRYLQHFDFSRLYESVREQQILRQIAPHLIQPFPFLVPCYGYGMKGKEVMQAGMMLYEVLTSSKNKNVQDSHKLPSHKILSKSETLQIAPYLEARGLRGAVIYYDCQMHNCERFTFSVVASAAQAGASVANYLQAEACEVKQGQISRVEVKDLLTDEKFQIRARFVVSASGPWTNQVVAKFCNSRENPKKVFSKGIQLVLPQIVDKYAVAVESRFSDEAAKLSRGGRSFFLQPWRGCTLIGTSDQLVEEDPDDFKISTHEISSFLEDVKSAYPDPKLNFENVLHAFGGLREVDASVLKKSSVGDATVARDAIVTDHSENGLRNLLSVVGVKYTTFRALSEEIVNQVQKKLGGQVSASLTSTTTLYSAGSEEQESVRKVESAICRGRALSLPAKLMVIEGGDGARPLHSVDFSDRFQESEFYKKVLKDEMVCHLDDFVMRRTGLGTRGLPVKEALEDIAGFVAKELTWSEERKSEELSRLICSSHDKI